MLDDLIIKEILRKERGKRRNEPQPLYLPLDMPPLPESPPESTPEESDVWNPDQSDGIIVIKTVKYASNKFYQ